MHRKTKRQKLHFDLWSRETLSCSLNDITVETYCIAVRVVLTDPGNPDAPVHTPLGPCLPLLFARIVGSSSALCLCRGRRETGAGAGAPCVRMGAGMVAARTARDRPHRGVPLRAAQLTGQQLFKVRCFEGRAGQGRGGEME